MSEMDDLCVASIYKVCSLQFYLVVAVRKLRIVCLVNIFFFCVPTISCIKIRLFLCFLSL